MWIAVPAVQPPGASTAPISATSGRSLAPENEPALGLHHGHGMAMEPALGARQYPTLTLLQSNLDITSSADQRQRREREPTGRGKPMFSSSKNGMKT